MVKFKVGNLNCSHCAQSIKEALSRLPEVGEIEVGLKTRTVRVKTESNLAEVLATLNKIGYPAEKEMEVR